MKNIELIEVPQDEIGGEIPDFGSEIVIRDIRYRVIGAKSSIVPPSNWKWRRSQYRQATWKLVVQRIEEASP